MRVAGGLLFELTGHSIGDSNRNEEDVPVILRSWQAQNFLITSMHVKGVINHLNVLGVVEVQVPRFSFFFISLMSQKDIYQKLLSEFEAFLHYSRGRHFCQA